MMKRKIFPNLIFFDWAEQMLRQGQEVEITVKGQSMRPFLMDGDRVTVTPVQPQASWRKGTIILARTGEGQVIMHRIFSVKDGHIVMKGDGNLHQTEQTKPADVMGIAKSAHRNGKTFPLYSLSQKAGSWFWRNNLVRRVGLWLFRICHHQ